MTFPKQYVLRGTFARQAGVAMAKWESSKHTTITGEKLPGSTTTFAAEPRACLY